MLVDYHITVDEKRAKELVAFLKTLDYVELEKEKPTKKKSVKTRKKKEPDFAYFGACPDWEVDADELRKKLWTREKAQW